MDKKITSIINGVESEYSKYDSTQYEHIGDLILLIKIIETEGDKLILLRNEYGFNMLVEKYKIHKNDLSIKVIQDIEDIKFEICEITNSKVFIFDFEFFSKYRDFFDESDLYIPSYESRLIIDDEDRKVLKEEFIISSINNGVEYFFSESLVSEKVKQRIERFDYSFTKISNRKTKKDNLNASGIKYVFKFKDFKLNELISCGIDSENFCKFYYPHKNKNEEESHEEAGIIEIIYPNLNEENKYIARFLWIYLGKANIGIDKVPTIFKDENNNYIFPEIISFIESEPQKLSYERRVPAKEEIYEVNAINSLLHFLKYGEVEYFNDDKIVPEINNILNSLIGIKFQFIATKSLYDINLNLKDDDSNYDIYILNAEDFLEFDGHFLNEEFDILKQIENWAVYFNRNLTYIL